MNVNLPEFRQFQSDHLVLAPQLLNHPLYDRVRGSSTFSSTKFNRQAINNNSISPTITNTVKTGSYTSAKRLSRSRHSYDTTFYYDKQQQQQQQKYTRRPMITKFDSISCFREPDLSSDENHNNLFRSPSLTNRYPIKAVTHPAVITDEDSCEIIEIMHQTDPITPTITSVTPTIPLQSSKCASSPRQSSHMPSPVQSTSSQSSGRAMTLLGQEFVQLPVHLEHEIRIKQNFDQLGLIVDASVDAGVNGCYVHSIAETSICTCLKPGDFIVSINNENMRKISNAQARSIIRRASLVGSDISLIFVSGDDAEQYKTDTFDLPSISPQNLDFDTEISPTKPSIINSYHDEDDAHDLIDTESLCATLWGPARTVVLYRNEQAKNLGISIVGGKLDFSGPGNTIETCISGIFVKHVIPDSPAGLHSTLKTGDRILEVNGYNLRDATHDHAVEIIRSTDSPIYFIVQSLLDPSNPVSSAANSTTQQIENDPIKKQYGHLDGELLLVDVYRNPAEMNEPLGFSLIGHRDSNKLAVFVCDVQSNSLLGRDNRIHPGDQLLQINDEPLLGKAHSTVTSIIKSIKSATLNFILLRNPTGVDEMALRNPYASSQHHDSSAILRHQTNLNECKDKNDRQTSTSASVLIKHTVDDKESMKNKKSTNSIRTPNDNTTILSDSTDFHSITPDLRSSLLNQAKNESLPRPSSLRTYVNEHQNYPTTSDVNLRSSNELKQDDNKIINEPVVSHIPIMSSSSSSSSLSIPTPSATEHKVWFATESKPKSLPFNDTSQADDDPRIRPILVGQETLIEIDRQQSGLGLSVVGGSDTQLSAIIIHDIYDGCAAQRDGRLLVGDQILEVNAINLRSATHEEGIQALRQPTNIIRILVLRGDIVNEEDKFDTITVDLIKKSGKGLGFSIIGRRHGCGVFISHIIEGGSAEKDGRLMSGDLIVEVNGQDLRTAAYEHVAYTLKTLPHGRMEIKIGRLRATARRNVVSNDSPTSPRSSSVHQINDR